MAGHDDRYRVGTVGQTNGANGFRILDAFRQLEIANRFTVGDPSQFLPHGGLKLRTVEGDWCRKFLQPPGEILIELLADRSEHTLYIRLPRRVDLARARHVLSLPASGRQ